MYLYSSLLLLPAVLQLAEAWRPKDAKCKDSDLCLTSFKWCENKKKDAACYYPKDVFENKDYSSQGPRPALIWDREYDITWNAKDDNDRVTIRWTFVDNNDANIDGIPYEWETNVTNTEKYTFKPSQDKFPNPASNITKVQALGLGVGLNKISIHQFKSDNPSSDDKRKDESDTFYLLPSESGDFLAHVKEATEDHWRILLIRWTIVGVVGGGIVASFVVAVCCMFWARFVYRRHGEKGLQGKKWFTGV
ncbi:hypothetical protein P154DRAFT_609693 [Amniculicola lignicola CBS 123094]|uniref:Uncharacterized protein n=1 Tax=Amniculicola lignicola CBS 123094 TaxID=1392246 RepID=A0A6A5WA38_9PLEO|nr:hypothetical protein P154DRAFT_609693 [Amniculicola lignicola CBS 123094]